MLDDTLGITRFHDSRSPGRALHILGALAQVVSLFGLTHDEFSGGRLAKTFLHAAFCFQFGHFQGSFRIHALMRGANLAFPKIPNFRAAQPPVQSHTMNLTYNKRSYGLQEFECI